MAVTRIDQAALDRLLHSPEGAVARDLLRRGNRVVNLAKRLCPVDTGRLRNSITAELVRTDAGPACRVGTNVSYARFVHDGTGLHGPLHRRITSPSGKVMRWRKPGKATTFGPALGNADYIFARSTQGMPGRPFLKDALVAAR